MAAKSWFQKQIEALKDDFEFRLETLILNITETISENMEKKGFNRSKFAEKLRVSPPAVTKILNGTSNFTLKTLLSIADALELNLKIDFEEKEKVSAIYPVEDKPRISLAVGEELEVSYVQIATKAYTSKTKAYTSKTELDWAA
jgi:transcriptional regulator with XRE-family HTH domain